MKGAAIIFDLDGTLVDTAPDLLRATNHIMARHGAAPVEAEVIRAAVGRGARQMIEAALASHGVTPGAGELNLYVEEFIAYYGEHIAVESRPFPGLIPALAALTRRGARLGVCTNKREGLARRLLAELELDHCFSAVLGGDSLPVRKPHPRHVLGAIEAVGGLRDAAVMVGDSVADIEAAKAASVPVIAVSFGYSPEPVDGLGADRVIGAFSELEDAVGGLIGRSGA
jgi:phosphoglycolate phosphatase